MRRAKEVVREVHSQYPGKPIVITEFGAEGIEGVHFDPQWHGVRSIKRSS